PPRIGECVIANQNSYYSLHYSIICISNNKYHHLVTIHASLLRAIAQYAFSPPMMNIFSDCLGGLQ
ncbi:MAG: hypothetical protein ACTTH7_08865, partial [Treponema sp.]